MLRSAPLLACVVLAIASCVASGDAPDQTEGVAVEAFITDCQKECHTFGTATCAEIKSQCDAEGDDQEPVAFAGAYVAPCDTAIELACGGLRQFQACLARCKGRDGR